VRGELRIAEPPGDAIRRPRAPMHGSLAAAMVISVLAIYGPAS
jgi:hypothetical protein